MNNIPGDEGDESEHFNDEQEEEDSIMPNKLSNPIVKKKLIASQSNYIEIIFRKQNMIEGKLEKSNNKYFRSYREFFYKNAQRFAKILQTISKLRSLKIKDGWSEG